MQILDIQRILPIFVNQAHEVVRYLSDEKTMIKIGDVCPLFFDTLKYEFASEGSFRQCFDLSDGILLQIFCDNGETPSVYLRDKVNGTREEVDFKIYNVNDSVVMYYTSIYPGEGIYSVIIEGKESEEFEVCDNPQCALIEYTHKDNNSVFDNIFWNGSNQLTFKMRIVGGFKPSGLTLEIDNEQFVNQKQEIVELYSIPYITNTLYIGDTNGVPYYIAEHLNKVFCLSDVRINGVNYVREGNAKPEKTETIGKKELFMWSMSLRPLNNPIAGIGGKVEEGSSTSVVGFSINNPTDGEVLVYSSDESAFVNTDSLNSI